MKPKKCRDFLNSADEGPVFRFITEKLEQKTDEKFSVSAKRTTFATRNQNVTF